MIFSKIWRSVKAQLNKVANLFWTADPIAQLQYEYDTAVEEMKAGREGLAQYRALVERVSQQVANQEKQAAHLKAKVQAYLKAGNREAAGRFALELQKANTELAENREQLELHEKAYENNLKKIKNASGKLSKVRDKITKYDAELKMSKAEAEMAEVASSLNFDVTTDFGQIEQVIQEKISLNRGKARVAADLSEEGITDIEHEEMMETALAENALKEIEIEMGLITPETSAVEVTEKQLGPAVVEQKEG